jgi:outer membrane protein assembly factor BamD (BamD/ComL family)
VKLEQSLARLRVSLAQFAVLRNAFEEATSTFDRFIALYPRK